MLGCERERRESRLRTRGGADVREDRWTVLADCAASPTTGGWEGHQRDAPPLRPDRGQDKARVLSLQKPLVARAALREHPRAYHQPDTLPERYLRDLLRPDGQQAGGFDQRG